MLKVLLHGEDHHPGKMLAFQLVDLRDLGFGGFGYGGKADGNRHCRKQS